LTLPTPGAMIFGNRARREMNIMRRIVFPILIFGLIVSGCRRGRDSGTAVGQAKPAAPVVSPAGSADAGRFVTVSNGTFFLAGRPYRFVGANFWPGMNLGVNGPSGDRPRLLLELDHLQRLGITNLRVMASSEGPNTEPFRIVPALMIAPGVYDESVLDGLDFLLAEMGKRGMRAVMVLNNFWQWSGGMAQYVSWHEKAPIPYPGDYEVFINYSAKFYSYAECQAWFRNHIAMLTAHTNPYTGLKYRDDPAVFSWELANEPRRYPQSWIDETAAFIKSLDPNHLVTTGSEGAPPGEPTQNFVKTHGGPDIDYVTIHIWPQNWDWFDPKNPATYKSAEPKAIAYFRKHVKEAASMRKPLVLEEFGLARDWEPLHDTYNPGSPTTYRNLFYAVLYKQVYDSMSSGGAAAGDNFWAWGGMSRPGRPWVGDPPHEPAGWYSVFNIDASTLAIISAHAREMTQGLK
jgi:mannan endo-1,4-beta-mannosidase